MLIWELFARLLARFLGFRGVKNVSFEGEKLTVILVKRIIPNWAWAQTWGRVILIKEIYYPQFFEDLMKHEIVHVRQWKRYKFLFPFLYLFYSLKAFILGKNPYYDNEFEVEAYKRN